MEEKYKYPGVFILSFILLYLIQFSTRSLLGIDGYFHIKYAELILEHGIIRNFTWWSFSSYADTHFLYHVALIPFLIFGPVTGAKVATVFFGALLFTVIYWFLRKQNVEHAHFWVLAIFAFGSDALFRYIQPRAFVLSLILMIFGFYFMLNKKYKYLGILMFIFAWTYTGYIILFGLLILYSAYEWFISGKIDKDLIKYSFLGSLLGTIVNPFFPDNLQMIYIQVFQVLISKPGLALLSADAQAYPSFVYFLSLFYGTLILFVFSVYRYFKDQKYTDQVISLFLISSVITFILTLRAMRFVEYWVPFTMILSALIFEPIIKKWIGQVIDFKDFKVNVDKKKVIAIFLIILIPFTILSAIDMIKLAKGLGVKEDAQGYMACARWLEKNTPEGTPVFNYWNEFPMFFFHNTHNRYITGLDPTYFYNYDPDLYRKYETVLLIKTNKTVDYLKNDFKVDYVVLGTFTKKLQGYYDAFNDLEVVFETPTCAVLKLKK